MFTVLLKWNETLVVIMLVTELNSKFNNRNLSLHKQQLYRYNSNMNNERNVCELPPNQCIQIYDRRIEAK